MLLGWAFSAMHEKQFHTNEEETSRFFEVSSSFVWREISEKLADVQVNLLDILWCACVFLGTCGVSNLSERVDIDATALRISISNRENLDALARVVPTGGNMPDKLRKRQRACIVHSICEHDYGLAMPGWKRLQLLILLINAVE